MDEHLYHDAPPSAVDEADGADEAGGLLADETTAADKLRLRHLADLVNRGALDQDIYEAVLDGTVYFLDNQPPRPELIEEFRIRYKCGLEVFADAAELLAAARQSLPDAVVLGDNPAGMGVCEVLPELQVAAFGAKPPAAIILSDDPAIASAFEILTYPAAAVLPQSSGAEALLEGLGRFLQIERTEAELRTDRAIKEQIGLSKAQAIQQKLLPEEIPSLPGLEIAAYYKACQEVGGDYYDFIPLPDGRLGVAIADVTGKGVSAAMVMVMFRSVLRLAAERDTQPHEVVRVTNQLISRDMLRGVFVTGIYLVYDSHTQKAVLVNAGHCPALLWRAAAPEPVELNIRGMAVGLVAGDRFAAATPQGELQLRPGDLLCLYTDGVDEAHNPHQEQFGVARLTEALRDAGRVSAQETVDRVIAEVHRFCDGAPQHDDTTLIVLKVTEP